MRIGIVTPAFNVAPYIGDTIRSVLAQTHGNWTMVVVDDGSTDETAPVLHRFDDSRLRVMTQRNEGVSAARNRGAGVIDCDAVLFLDGDDWLAPHAMAAVGAYERGGRTVMPVVGSPLGRLLIRNLFVNGGHVLIRKQVVRPFRSDLRYGEDWEFWVRLALSPGNDPAAFVAVADRRPVLHVRERASGAYIRMSTDPAAFTECINAIHDNPALPAIYPPAKRASLRRRAEAEVLWTVGRELIRHRRYQAGLSHLSRSLMRAPTARRIALLAAIAVLPPRWRGPLYPYQTFGR